jgi:hypothetical protein
MHDHTRPLWWWMFPGARSGELKQVLSTTMSARRVALDAPVERYVKISLLRRAFRPNTT